MRVAEIFYSLQGEGALAGVPSVFIRTAGCNLRCRWCDSKYASGAGEGRELDVETIVREVDVHPTRFCVITGGEPMLANDIHALAGQLAGCDKHVTLETAATVPPGGIACALASLSPKLSNSTPGEDVPAPLRRRHEAQRVQLDVIREWVDRYEYQLKFVISSGPDIDEVTGLLARLERAIPPEKVLLMPEGVEAAGSGSVADAIVAACKRYGFRYCDRLHIRLFGNQRGT